MTVINTDENQLGEKGFISEYWFQPITEGRQGMDSGQEPRGDHGETLFTNSLPRLAQLTLFYRPGPPAQGWCCQR